MCKLGRFALVLRRQHSASNGIFQRQQSGAREMIVVRLDGARDTLERDPAVRFVLQGLRLDTAENGGAALLVFIGMRFLSNEKFIAAAAVRHQCGQVALSAGWKKQGAFEPKPFGGDRLQSIYRRIVAEHIITDFAGRHGRTHARRRPRDRIAAQVNHDFGALGSELNFFSASVPWHPTPSPHTWLTGHTTGEPLTHPRASAPGECGAQRSLPLHARWSSQSASLLQAMAA